MFSHIEEHITQREAHLARSLQGARVIAVRKQPARALKAAIDGAGDANRQALDAARERATVVRFCDQMQMIALHAEVHQREAELLLGRGQSLTHHHEQRVLAQRAHCALHAQRDVQRVVTRMGGPAQMRDPGPIAAGLPTSARASPAPGPKHEPELTGGRSHDI